MKKGRADFWIKWMFLLGLFGVLLLWSMMQPFGAPPDEAERYKITEFILKHGTLPHGGDPEIMLEGWGFSYGFQPILPYILSAVFVKIIALFSSSEYVFIVAARLVNVLSGVLMAFFVWKIGEKLFRERYKVLLFLFLVCLLPQEMFMHTYVNVDSMALMSSALIVWSWIEGRETGWNNKSCCLLGIGMGLCAMSYYNAYGYILCSIFMLAQSFISWDAKKKKLHIDWKNLLRKGALAGGIAFLLAGWWFIRSAVLYDGDFLGLRTRDAYAERYAVKHLKPSSAPTWKNAGFSIIDMLKESDYLYLLTRSFVGMFGHMNLPLPDWMYKAYFVLLGAGLVSVAFLLRKKQTAENGCRQGEAVFQSCMAANVLIPFLLCTWVAYEMDYQPQGRYILPMLIPFMYYITSGISAAEERILGAERKKTGAVLIYALCAAVFILSVCSFKGVIFTKYYFNFITMFKADWRTFFM